MSKETLILLLGVCITALVCSMILCLHGLLPGTTVEALIASVVTGVFGFATSGAGSSKTTSTSPAGTATATETKT
jgi:branched-subunit amino acid transport protein